MTNLSQSNEIKLLFLVYKLIMTQLRTSLLEYFLTTTYLRKLQQPHTFSELQDQCLDFFSLY